MVRRRQSGWEEWQHKKQDDEFIRERQMQLRKKEHSAGLLQNWYIQYWSDSRQC